MNPKTDKALERYESPNGMYAELAYRNDNNVHVVIISTESYSDVRDFGRVDQARACWREARGMLRRCGYHVIS